MNVIEADSRRVPINIVKGVRVVISWTILIILTFFTVEQVFSLTEFSQSERSLLVLTCAKLESGKSIYLNRFLWLLRNSILAFRLNVA